MLDPALLVALQAPFPPPAPEIVEERQWLSPKAESVRRNFERLVADYEQAILVWQQRVRSNRTTLALGAAGDPLSSSDRLLLDQLIDDVEQHSEERAIRKSRLEKRMKRDVKRAFARDPSLGAVLRSFMDRLLEADRSAIDEWLEHALWLRAFRADRLPGSRGGRVFSDPADLERHLETVLA